MKTYWWNERPNFGDSLAPYILSRFSGLPTTWGGLHECDFIVTGSVLHHVPRDYRGVIVGAGRLRSDLPVEIPDADIRAVRGPMSALGLPYRWRGGCALGDPGLLADEMVSVSTRDIDLGILPHWSDRELINRPEFKIKGAKVIAISPENQNPLAVVEQIGRCKKLVTSSLHGMIVADAFGIPRRFETCELFTLDTLFKFQDYSASVHMPLQIGKLQQAHRGHVESVKHELYDAFESLRPLQ